MPNHHGWQLPPALRSDSPVRLRVEGLDDAIASITARAPGFRVYLDDTCNMPTAWRADATTGNIERSTSKYAAELYIPQMLARSSFVTHDWKEANASLVVLSVVQFGGTVLAPERCRRVLARDSAAWRATGGTRHFFVLTQDRGPCCHSGEALFPEFLRHHIIGHHGEMDGHHWRPSGIRMAPSAGLPCFSAYKDISIPTSAFTSPFNGSSASPSEKDLLIFYAGGGPSGALLREGRRLLLKHWGNTTHADVHVLARTDPASYARDMRRARYCPIMGGFAPWTPRLVEAIFAGCVPVFFSSWLPPFSRILNWSLFSIRVPSLHLIPQLKSIVLDSDYARMARHLLHVRSAFWYQLQGGFQWGSDMLPFLLVEMQLALRAAAAEPLVERARALLGFNETALEQDPLRRRITSALAHVPRETGGLDGPWTTAMSFVAQGAMAVLANRTGHMAMWRCQPELQSTCPEMSRLLYDALHFNGTMNRTVFDVAPRAPASSPADWARPCRGAHSCKCRLLRDVTDLPRTHLDLLDPISPTQTVITAHAQATQPDVHPPHPPPNSSMPDLQS